MVITINLSRKRVFIKVILARMWCSSDFTAKILVQRVLMLASGREKGGKRENRNDERICPKNKQIGFFLQSIIIYYEK